MRMAAALPSLSIRRLTPILLRAPSTIPVVAAFGVMTHRTSLLVRIEDEDGAVGWGEVYANFPVGAGEHRARLLAQLFASLVVQAGPCTPPELYARLEQATRILGLQSGEVGPLAQCVAGIDIAAWDLAARRQALPLWQALQRWTGAMAAGPAAAGPLRLPVYASGINPETPERLARAAREAGHRAFKLKLGFGRDRDLANVAAVRRELGQGVPLMLDANQAWSLGESLAMAGALAEFGPDWLEEPMPADASAEAWRGLADASAIPLAGGENLRSRPAFEDAIGERLFQVLQPDPIKWGGFSGTLPVVANALAAGLRFCPHYLGGGIGLVACAHLLAAVAPTEGLLEYDTNLNPLREGLIAGFPPVVEGGLALPEGPGLAVVPDLLGAAGYLVGPGS